MLVVNILLVSVNGATVGVNEIVSMTTIESRNNICKSKVTGTVPGFVYVRL